jgi:phage shock protein E
MYRLLLLIFFWPNLIFSAVFIDVRTAEEFESESIMNTQNIEWQNILDIQKLVSKDEEIFLFCRSGKRSGKAKKILEAEGYNRVINIGGFEEAKEFISAKGTNS